MKRLIQAAAMAALLASGVSAAVLNPLGPSTTASAAVTCSGDPIVSKYYALGGYSFFGAAVTGELAGPNGGVYQRFQNADLYWRGPNGTTCTAYEVHGLIRQKYLALGGAWSFLGYPVTDETWEPGYTGKYNNFEYGTILWKYGAAAAF